MNNKKYNATFILDTRGYTEPVETLIEKIKSVMESVGCKISNIENLGQKSFVRVTDKKFPSGIYVEVSYEAPSAANAQVREKFRLDKTIDRIMILSE